MKELTHLLDAISHTYQSAIYPAALFRVLSTTADLHRSTMEATSYGLI